MSSNRIIDGSSIFTGEDTGKDGLKKEFGVYYEIEEGSVISRINQSTPYLLTLGPAQRDDTGLLPFYTQTIRINSASYVSDYDEWLRNLRSKFIPNAEYIDHYFIQPSHQCRSAAVNKFESYGYEFLSKRVPPLSLLSIYDEQEFPIEQDMTNYLDQFSINRIETQRRSNMFMGDRQLSLAPTIALSNDYNSFIKLTFDTTVPTMDQGVSKELFEETALTNKLFSFFKRTTGIRYLIFMQIRSTHLPRLM